MRNEEGVGVGMFMQCPQEDTDLDVGFDFQQEKPKETLLAVRNISMTGTYTFCYGCYVSYFLYVLYACCVAFDAYAVVYADIRLFFAAMCISIFLVVTCSWGGCFFMSLQFVVGVLYLIKTLNVLKFLGITSRYI